MDILIKNGLVVRSEGSCIQDIRISGGAISEMGEHLSEDGCEVTDAQGCLIFPGFIDARVYFEMFNGVTTTADDFRSGTQAALAGGVTTVLDVAVQSKGRSLREAIEEKERLAHSRAACDYGFIAAVTDYQTARSELSTVYAQGITSFLAHMSDEHQLSPNDIAALVKQVHELGGLTQIHCEDPQTIDAIIAQHAADNQRSILHYPSSRPTQSEASAVKLLGEIALQTASPVCVSPITCKEALEELRKARKSGAQLYAEASLPYFLLDSQLYFGLGLTGSKYVCRPPLRTKEDNMALWSAARHSELDFVTSAHCGYNFGTQKIYGVSDYTRVPSGMPGVQLLPLLMYSYGMLDGIITENQLVYLLCEAPAKLFGLYPRKGRLQIGADADLVIWRRYTKSAISVKQQLSQTDYTPYENMSVQGEPAAVYLRGQLCATSGTITAASSGQYLARGNTVLTRQGK